MREPRQVRIALDVTPAARPRRTGIGWYAQHLAVALTDALSPGDELNLCTRLSRWRARDQRARAPRARNRWFQAPWGPMGRPQIFHGTDARLPERCRAALVATVHDVFSLDSPHWANARFRARKRQHYEEIATRAQRIVFDSQATRDRFITYFPDTRDRGRVVHLGIDAGFRPAPPTDIARVRERHGLPERYALFVGEISKRKNLPNQARALSDSGCGLPWVWIGRDSFGAEEIHAQIQQLPELRIVRPGYLPAEDLPAVYSGATLLTFTSWDEGFGLPALEAMACGTPAVVTDRGALPEITEGAALRADPGDPAAIASAILRIAEDEELREHLTEVGLQHARRFSWAKTALETLAVYRELVPEN